MDKLKGEFLKLLERDVEFKYAVAGYLGLSEILKRLDKLEEGHNRLLEEQKKLWEGQNKLWEGQKRIWENIEKLWEEIRLLREDQKRLWENQNRIWEELKELREGQNRLWEEVRSLKVTQARLTATIDRLTITIEEEGIDVVGRRLRDELELDIKLGRIFVDDKEVNMYGSSADICVIGEATFRLGRRLVEELEEKIRFLREVKPELIKPKMIKVIYTDYAVPEAINLAKEYGIWVLNWKGDITSRKIHS